jgi:hypothetical protein
MIWNSLDWAINRAIGLLRISIGWFLRLRAKEFYRYYLTIPSAMRKSPSCICFLRLDLLLVLISCFAGGLLLVASVSRVFRESYAVSG